MNKLSLFLVILFFSTPALAEITFKPCPYTCRTEGIPKKQCKDWKESGMCFIDDLRRGRAGQMAPGYDRNNIIKPLDRNNAVRPPEPYHNLDRQPPQHGRFDYADRDDRRDFDRYKEERDYRDYQEFKRRKEEEERRTGRWW